jgi:methyl-accepting chemotaxis protein
MLFKNAEGVYVEILRSNYTTDTAYYKSIMNVKGCAKVNEMSINVNEMTINVNEMTGNVNEMTGNVNEMTGNVNEMNVNENEMNVNENVSETKINEMSRIRSILRKHP